MLHSYPRASWLLRTALLLAPAGAALAQAPVITSVIPMANARAARSGPVTVNFSQPLTAASAGALKVFSAQRGGLRTRGATPAVVSGNALSFAPTAYDFQPGEKVQYTVTTAVAGSGGPLARARVGQFTAAVGGTGEGNFQLGTDVAVTSRATADVAVGDLDGDGDLDMLVSNSSSSAVLGYVNDGSGQFRETTLVSVNFNPKGMALGDVDGDGDLDLVVANKGLLGTVSVRLNDGNARFSGSQDVPVLHEPKGVVLGDVDGDGDLDMLVAQDEYPGLVSVRLNDGSGTFGGGQEVNVASTPPSGIAVGDVDGDGDLDLLAAINTSGSGTSTVSVRFNDGSGTFGGSGSSGGSVAVGDNPRGIVLGDVDGDGDLDLATANNGGLGAVSVRLNNGSGTAAARR